MTLKLTNQLRVVASLGEYKKKHRYTTESLTGWAQKFLVRLAVIGGLTRKVMPTCRGTVGVSLVGYNTRLIFKPQIHFNLQAAQSAHKTKARARNEVRQF